MDEQIRSVRRGRPPRAEVYGRLDVQIQELWQRMGGLPNPAEAADIWRGIWFEEAHHSTAIEGNTLVLRQVEALLAEGRAVGDKELREYMEVKGYGDAADWVYRQAVDPGAWAGSERLTLSELRQIHRAAMTPVWDVAPHPHATDREGPGSFREHDIEPFPGGMRPPSWPIVASETELWITAVNELRPRAGICRGRRASPLPVRGDSPVPGRQRSHRAPRPQPDPGTARLSPRDHLQASTRRLPARAAAGGCR